MRNSVDPRFSELDVPPPDQLPGLVAPEADSFVDEVESGEFQSRAQIRAAHVARPGPFFLTFSFAFLVLTALHIYFNREWIKKVGSKKLNLNVVIGLLVGILILLLGVFAPSAA